MAIDTINIGSAPNDGTGDPLRTAFNKTNTNFLNITADGGDEITVLNPTTSTDTTLNVALQDVFDAGGGGAVSSVNGQTGAVLIDLESVLTEGGRGIKTLSTIITSYDFLNEDKGKIVFIPAGNALTDLNIDYADFDFGDSVIFVSNDDKTVTINVNCPDGFAPNVDTTITYYGGYMLIISKIDPSGLMTYQMIPYNVSTLESLISENNNINDLSLIFLENTGEYGSEISSSGLTTNRNSTNEQGTFDWQKISFNDLTQTLSIFKDKIQRLKGSFYTNLTFTDPTANRVITFKDESGTVAYLSDISGVGATQNARATRLELTNNISLPISPTGSVTVIDFDNSIFNVDPTVFTNNGAGTVTCTLAGNYLVTTSIVLESPLASAITKSELGIRKNGSTVVCATTDDTPIALGNNIRSLTTSTIINLSANDTLQAVVNLFGASATGQALRLPTLFGTTATQVSNISIERLEVSEFDVDSTIINGSANAVSGNAVFDGLALKEEVFFKSTTTSTAVTGTTSNTILVSALIPANTFTTGSDFRVLCNIQRVGGNAGASFRMYANTTNSLSGATQLATFTNGATNLFSPFARTFPCRATNLVGVSTPTSSALSDFTTTLNSAYTTQSFNFSVDNYIIIAVQPSSALDSFTSELFTIKGNR